MPKYKNKEQYLHFVGKKYNKLTILSIEKRKRCQAVRVLCKCECGIIKTYNLQSIIRFGTKSCGCNKLQNISKRGKPGQTGFRIVYRRYKIQAKKKKLKFELTKKFFKTITQKNCYYCNSTPQNVAIHTLKRPKYISKKKWKYRTKTPGLSETQKIGMYIYNGIDRKNNNLGYIKSNCIPCCKYCNVLKGDRSIKDFYNHVKKLYKHLFKSKIS